MPAPLAFVPRERAATPGVDPSAGADPGGAPAEIGAAEAARVVALAVAEALRGQRTVQQLGHHLDLECYRKVERRVRWEREARAMARSAPDPGVLRVLSCHVQAIGERVRECTASLASAERVRAWVIEKFFSMGGPASSRIGLGRAHQGDGCRGGTIRSRARREPTRM